MPRSPFRPALAGAAAAAALLLASCGVQAGDTASGLVTVDGPGRPAEGYAGAAGTAALRRSAEATADVGTQKMSLTMTMSGVPMMGDIEITAEGEIDTAAKRSHITMDMGDLLSMLGETDGTIEMIIDGDDAYLRSDLYRDLAGTDAEWLHANASDLSGQDLAGAPQGDPTKLLSFLEQAGGEVEEVGTEQVRGVETRHLRTDVDLAHLAESVSPEEAADLRDSLDQLGLPEGSTLTLPTDVWVDEDGMVRKFEMVFDFSQLASGSEEGELLGSTKMTMSYELWDFGEPVDIQIPPASEVGELDPSMLAGD